MAIDSAKTILPYSSKDALSAIEMIRNKAKKYNIDPNKIGLMGFSAGGAVTMEATYKSTPKISLTLLPQFIHGCILWKNKKYHKINQRFLFLAQMMTT